MTLTGNPTAPTPTSGDNDTSVATTAFVTTAIAAQPVAMNDNRLINGDMRIDQRNNGASGTATGVYTVDRWVYSATQASKGAWGRGSSSAPGFPYHLLFTSSSAYTPIATDYFFFQQSIEADMVSDFAWGTAGAQPVTLSFWATSTLTGTFGGAVKNYAGTRSYPFTFSIPAANTWTKIVITIPGDTAGTWVMSGAGGAIALCFDLGAGTNFRGPANAWAAGNFIGANGAVSVVATNGAVFYVTGVKLEIGSVATPFNRQSMAKSMADCQRYYQQRSAAAEGAASIVGPMQAFGTGSVFGLAPFGYNADAGCAKRDLEFASALSMRPLLLADTSAAFSWEEVRGNSSRLEHQRLGNVGFGRWQVAVNLLWSRFFGRPHGQRGTMTVMYSLDR